jgi:Fe-S cluster biogenesis protein NfuA
VTDPIKITGEFTPDPNVCRFIVDRTVLDGWTLIFRDRSESMHSPLIDDLFDIEGIVRVKVSDNTLTITKDVELSWPELARGIVPCIRAALSGPAQPISPEALAAVQSGSVEGLGEKIEELFERRVNPMLAMHGGYVKMVKIEGRDVYLEMGGGCQGCAASQATLRQGIESAIREVVPHVGRIIDVTNHDAGANPYYR